ncbi:carboxylesterase/lipase family protein [Streptomyces sp. NPDC052396]|uniref:carboxylesterase/lipase family protein n=1 Tax=Streptomyces sp. NPDC052396 TaxID=3365689 RepID=UPI0037D5CD96
MPPARFPGRAAGALRALLLAPLLVLVCAAPPSWAAPPEDAPLARTGTGLVRGRAQAGYLTYEGIPYAAPPVGPLRWRDPRPARPWTGVRDAGAPGPRCPQVSPVTGRPDGAEDCLTLNVTVPAGPAPGPGRPVLVWLHGGGFVYGSGADYRGERLAVRGEVMVVTVNYRLGVFGFFGHPALDGSDFGFADQQAALRWVRANARAFGGDPGQVTLFGESAGALSVCGQLVSPTAAGLFQRAVLQSGSCLTTMPPGATYGAAAWSPWRSLGRTRAEGAAAARRLGCPGGWQALACLRALPAGRLATADLMAAFSTVSYGTAPVPLRPDRALRQGRFQHVPVIQGTNHDEMRYFVALDFAAHPLRDRHDYRARLRQSFGGAAGAIERRYPAARYPTPALAWAAVLTDVSFSCSTLRADRALARQVPVYGYEFDDQRAPNGFGLPAVPEVPYGAAHGFELPYLFPVPVAFTPPQRHLVRRMTGDWTRFAHGAAPAGWPRWTERAPRVRSLAPEGDRAVDAAAEHQCAFWDRYRG